MLAAALSLLASACVSPDLVSAAPVNRGAALAEANCSSCHAIGRNGDSPAPEAPPFRRLSQHYRVADLQEALTAATDEANQS